MNSKPIWLSLLLTLLSVGTAHAQSVAPAPIAPAPIAPAPIAPAPIAPAWYPQQYPAHISIQAAPFTELEVVPVSALAGSPAVARCKEYCDFWAWPGKYTLYSRNNSTGQRKELALRIKNSSRYVFEEGDDDTAKTGLALGIVGSTAAMTGMIMLAVSLLDSTCHGSCSNDSHDVATAGLVVFLTGAVIGPIGWTMYASNRTRLHRYDQITYRPAETRSQVRVGVVGVGLGGFGLGGVATF